MKVRLISGWVALVCATSAFAQDSALRQAPVVIQAPFYGDTLFNFFQDRYFGAITSLMVSQTNKRLSPHDDEAEVLRGGLLLGWGLHEQAAEVFTQLIDRKAAPAVRDRAWFFLGRMRAQRGLFESAQDALSRVSAPLLDGLEPDRQLLQAQLLLQRGDATAAAQVLRGVTGTSVSATVARFNLGVSLISSGDVDGGSAVLDALGQLKLDGAPAADHEELKTLRDRANVALGFSALQANKPREARVALQRVRLSGASANKALLGYGWAAQALKDPQLALVPWAELTTRNASDPAVLEAFIAAPYALSEIGAYGQALQGYEKAVSVFAEQQQGLDARIADVRKGEFIQGLVQQNPAADSLGGPAQLNTLPSLTYSAQLVPLLASHPFQEGFKQIRDLRFAANNLREWTQNLVVFGDMLDNRKAAFAQRLPQVRDKVGAINLGVMQERNAALAAELARVEAENDVLAYANPREQALLDRITRAQATLDALKHQAAELEAVPAGEGSSTVKDAAERLQRAQGAMQWQLSQDFKARHWAAQKAQREAQATLAGARERDAALLAAQQAEPERHARFSQRINELNTRVQNLLPQVAALDQEAQAQLQELTVAELQAQKARLDTYLTQARLAMAQILDRAQLTQPVAQPVAQPGAKP